MRELPEPDGYIGANDQDQDAGDDGWLRSSVLSIQRQAYEDGLRDAWQRITDNLPKNEEFSELRNGMILATNLIAGMLTASQKEVE